MARKLPRPVKDGYFLYGQGKMYGPFDRREFEFLYRKGVILKFDYFWDTKSKDWYNVEVLKKKAEAQPEKKAGEKVDEKPVVVASTAAQKTSREKDSENKGPRKPVEFVMESAGLAPVLSEDEEKTLEATLTQRVAGEDEETVVDDSPPGLDPNAKAKPGKVSAICFDQVNLINGILPEYSDRIFSMVTHDPSVFPPFPNGTMVRLNLLNELAGTTTNAEARVVATDREEEGWHIQFEWVDCPRSFLSI